MLAMQFRVVVVVTVVAVVVTVSMTFLISFSRIVVTGFEQSVYERGIVVVCIYSYIAIILAYSVIFYPVVYDLFLYCHGIALLV